MPYPSLLHPEPLSLWQSTADPYLPRRCSRTVLSQSLRGPWVLVHSGFCLCPPRVYFPVLCKFWWLCGGVNRDFLQESLCHTQSSCSSPLLTHASSGDTQTQFCLSLCGVSGSLCTQGMFEPSEHLWQVWGLVLNVIFAPPTILLGLLYPWTWGISSFSLQRLTSNAEEAEVELFYEEL